MLKRILTQVSKWILQFITCSVFVFIVVFVVNPRGSMGTQILFMLFTLPFAITAGIIFGDTTLHKTKIFSILAALVSIFLSIGGIILSLFVADMAYMIPDVIAFIAYYAVLVLPSLVGYNYFSYLKRRKSESIVKAVDRRE